MKGNESLKTQISYEQIVLKLLWKVINLEYFPWILYPDSSKEKLFLWSFFHVVLRIKTKWNYLSFKFKNEWFYGCWLPNTTWTEQV